jgi:hypothetical protein
VKSNDMAAPAGIRRYEGVDVTQVRAGPRQCGLNPRPIQRQSGLNPTQSNPVQPNPTYNKKFKPSESSNAASEKLNQIKPNMTGFFLFLGCADASGKA